MILLSFLNDFEKNLEKKAKKNFLSLERKKIGHYFFSQLD